MNVQLKEIVLTTLLFFGGTFIAMLLALLIVSTFLAITQLVQSKKARARVVAIEDKKTLATQNIELIELKLVELERSAELNFNQQLGTLPEHKD